MYLNVPTNRNGTSNICRVFSKMTWLTVSANDEPMIRIDMMVPAISRAFFPPIRFTISGAKPLNGGIGGYRTQISIKPNWPFSKIGNN